MRLAADLSISAVVRPSGGGGGGAGEGEALGEAQCDGVKGEAKGGRGRGNFRFIERCQKLEIWRGRGTCGLTQGVRGRGEKGLFYLSIPPPPTHSDAGGCMSTPHAICP